MNERQARRTVTKCLLKGIKEGDIKPLKGYSLWGVYQIGNYLLVVSPYFMSATPRDTPYEKALALHTTSSTHERVEWWHSAFPFTSEGRQNHRIRESLAKANYRPNKTEPTPLYGWVIPCD